MTLENVKRLLKHYESIGYESAAKDLLKKHPSLKDGEIKRTTKVQSGKGKRKAKSKSDTREKE